MYARSLTAIEQFKPVGELLRNPSGGDEYDLKKDDAFQ
jgi:hypothetical protein